MSTSVPNDSQSPARPVILIVGYKAYDELAGCLASIARHEPAARVVVVDHAADPSRGRVLSSGHPSVAYLPTADNPGFSAGVNRAARHAGPGAALLVLNPDCELTGPVLDPLARLLAEHPRAGVVGGRVRETDGSVQASARAFPDWTTGMAGRTSWLTRVAPNNPLTRRNLKHDAGALRTPSAAPRDVPVVGHPSTPIPDPSTWAPGHQSTWAPVGVDWVSGAFMLIRRETFDALGGFDERFFLYWEDADFCRRALDAGWTTLYAPAVEVVHHTSRTTAHAPTRSLVAFHISALRYHWNHGGLFARLLSPLVATALAARLALRMLRA